MLKIQTTLEYIIILAVIVLIGVGFFYFYISSINHQAPAPNTEITNLQIDNFSMSSTATSCNVGMSFQSTTETFNPDKFNILAQNYTGHQFNISVSTNDVSYYSTPENNYQFNYYFNVPDVPFCNMFTEFISSTSGEINGLLIYVNGTPELYPFNPPIKTIQ